MWGSYPDMQERAQGGRKRHRDGGGDRPPTYFTLKYSHRKIPGITAPRF